MKWSFKLGRMLGIDVYVHVTFLLLMGFIGASNYLAAGTLAAVLGGVLFFLALFGCVLLHEFGHSLMARRYGIGTADITLLPIGGVARLERMPEKPQQEIAVALAGPAVNVGISAVLVIWIWMSGSWMPPGQFSAASGGFAERLLVANVFLVLFNMLPAFPMDGGRVLRGVLALKMDHPRATRIAGAIGQGMALLFAVAGIFFIHNPMLLLIALFVWMGASQETAASQVKSALAGLPVREAMLTDFRTLSASQTLRDATELLLQGSQRDFPVMEEGEVAGVLVQARLFEALREGGQETRVGEIMATEFPTVQAGDLLENVLGQADPGAMAMPVFENGRLVGLLTADNIGELMMIRAIQAQSKLPPPLPRRG